MELPRKNNGRSKSWRIFWLAAGSALLVFALVGVGVVQHFRHRLPPELMLDIRAGIAARNISDPDLRFQKFLEGRYGSLSNPTNRQTAFLGFFDPDHIRAMQLLVRHSPANMRQANINASAKWLEHYRESLTGQERADLTARLQSAAGQSLLRQANAQYNSQDVWYRGQTAPVVSQLLKTVSNLQKP